MIILHFVLLHRAQLFDLAVSLLPGIGPQETDVLFTAIRPALEVCDSLLYIIISFLCSLCFLQNSDCEVSPVNP